MSRSIFFVCFAVCISATIIDRNMDKTNGSAIQPEPTFWKAIMDFLVKFNSPAPRGDQAHPAARSGDLKKTKLKDGHHPYMTAIYNQISDKQHQKWTAMETEGGATIRGIEPYKVTIHDSSFPASAILEFSTETIDSLDDLKHVELCLSSASQAPPEGATGPFRVELVPAQAHEEVPQEPLRTYRQQDHVFLELTAVLRAWWRRQPSRRHRQLRLRLSREDGAVFRPQRPLLVFYYKASGPEKTQDQALFGAAHAALLRRTRDVHMPPRLCNHCVYGERKAPAGQKHRRHNNQSPCALHLYYISLTDLKWDNLFVQPTNFQMNFCSGSCKGAMADTNYNATMHAIARAKLLSHHPEKEADGIPMPYCVPSKLKDIDSMYEDGQGNIVVKKWENIVAEQCGCS